MCLHSLRGDVQLEGSPCREPRAIRRSISRSRIVSWSSTGVDLRRLGDRSGAPAHPVWVFGFTISMAIAGSCQCKGESDLMIRHLRFAVLPQLSAWHTSRGKENQLLEAMASSVEGIKPASSRSSISYQPSTTRPAARRAERGLSHFLSTPGRRSLQRRRHHPSTINWVEGQTATRSENRQTASDA